jgi:hypothetical protein
LDLRLSAILLGCLIGTTGARSADLLDTLLHDYKSYGLPLPPKDAFLAQLPDPRVSYTNWVRHQDMHVVLVVKKPTPKEQGTYWLGCAPGWMWHGIELRPVPARRASLDNTVPLPMDFHRRAFPTYPDLALAIQCHALGWKEVAEAFLERSCMWPHQTRPALAELAWNYYCNRFVRATTERKAIVEHMKRILAGSRDLATEDNRNILRDMEQTLVEVKVLPGSLEAAVEALLDLEADWVSWAGGGFYDDHNDAERSPLYRKLRDEGLRAVSILLRHREDFRLTRSLESRRDGGYVWHIRIADVVAQLLNALADEPFTTPLLVTQGRGVCLRAWEVEAWWKATKDKSERDYLLNHLERKQGRQREDNEPVLKALGARYPDDLVRLFEERLNGGKASHSWFTALAGSTAPKETKARLFLAAAKKPDEWSQVLALRELVSMKHSEAAPLLIKALQAQPKTPIVQYWRGHIHNFAQIATCTTDEDVWKVLLETAKRVDVGQRMQILYVCGGAGSAKEKRLMVNFLKSFLEDKEVRNRNTSGLYDGPVAAFLHERITVRDYAAERLASVLGLKIHAEPTWKEAQWQELRKQVEAALAEFERQPKKD